jgi:hypothetical protein
VNGLPTPLHRFRLSFYARGGSHSDGDDRNRVAYVVSYGIDPMTGIGYVYLPGKGDESYALNTTTIDRGCEGKWFRATAAWQSTFESIVRQSSGAAGP